MSVKCLLCLTVLVVWGSAIALLFPPEYRPIILILLGLTVAVPFLGWAK